MRVTLLWHSVQCALYIVHCTMFSVQCLMCRVQCAVYSVQSIMCSVECTVFTVQCGAHFTVYYHFIDSKTTGMLRKVIMWISFTSKYSSFRICRGSKRFCPIAAQTNKLGNNFAAPGVDPKSKLAFRPHACTNAVSACKDVVHPSSHLQPASPQITLLSSASK